MGDEARSAAKAAVLTALEAAETLMDEGVAAAAATVAVTLEKLVEVLGEEMHKRAAAAVQSGFNEDSRASVGLIDL